MTRRKVLGVVGHNYLRETGIVQIQQDFDVAIFAKPSSALHRIAKYSCPLQTIDLADHQFLAAVLQAERRGVRCDGFLSIRDWNVVAAAKAMARLDKAPPVSSIRSLEVLKHKSKVRERINRRIDGSIHTIVDYEVVSHKITQRQFRSTLKGFLEGGAAILKPDRGSCSYYITRIADSRDISKAWDQFRSAAEYRGGDFILERAIDGAEYPVDSIVLDTVESVYIAEYLPRLPGKFFEQGIVVPAILKKEQVNAIETLIKALHSSLDLRNIVTHIEVILPKWGPPAVVEVNPRLAGDLMQELYRLVHGIEFYRVAAYLALGLKVPNSLLSPRAGIHKNAAILFSPPSRGELRLKANPANLLKHSDERFGLVFGEESVLEGGETNDDRPAYMLAVGANRIQMIKRAKMALSLGIQTHL